MTDKTNEDFNPNKMWGRMGRLGGQVSCRPHSILSPHIALESVRIDTPKRRT